MNEGVGKGRRARRAPGGWRPPQALNESVLTYAATVEDSTDPYVVDASGWGAPRPLTIELLQAIQALVEVEGAWRRRGTVQTNSGKVRAFAQWVGRWDDPNVAEVRQPQRISEITPGMWSAWSISLMKPGAKEPKRTLLQVAQVLAASGLLTAEASLRVCARKGSIIHGTVEHYTDAEFRAIVTSAKRVVREAHARITSNYAAALAHEGSERVPTRESVLHQMLASTIPRTTSQARLIGSYRDSTYFDSQRNGLRPTTKILKQDARRLLYLDSSEAFAAMVLLACLRGLNLSQIEGVSVPDRSIDSADEFSQMPTDKPRSGARRRFSLEVFGDDGDDSDGRWLRRIEEMTEPIRHHSRLIGQPRKDLIAYFGATGTMTFRSPGTIDRRRMAWLEDLAVIDYKRIKRTFETRHRKESTQNTEAVHIVEYLLRDPERIAEYQERATDGIDRAYAHAVSKVRLRFLTEGEPETETAEDSTLSACVDPEHEPRTGLPCHDGFLGCLSCSNAIATNRHLPLMRFTLGLLDEVRAVIPDDQWSVRFADAHSQLTYLVAAAPRATLERRVTRAQKALIRAAIGLPEGAL